MNVFRVFGTFLPLVFVASLALGARATAAEEPKAPRGDMAQVIEEARRAREMGDLAKAIEDYSHAYLVTGDTRWLFTLGDVHREAGHDSVALKIFQTYLRRDPQGAYVANAKRQVQELEGLLNSSGRQTSAAPNTAPPPAPPAVPTTPPESAIDSQKAPPTAAAIAAPPAPAPAPTTTPSPVPASHPRTPSPAAPSATTSPAASLPPAPAPSDAAVTPSLDLSQKAAAPTAANEPPLPRWLPWALTAATLATGTAAVIAGLSASDHYDSLKSTCGQTVAGCTPSQIDAVRSRASRANLLWAATGVVAVATGITFFMNINQAGIAGVW